MVAMRPAGSIPPAVSQQTHRVVLGCLAWDGPPPVAGDLVVLEVTWPRAVTAGPPGWTRCEHRGELLQAWWTILGPRDPDPVFTVPGPVRIRATAVAGVQLIRAGLPGLPRVDVRRYRGLGAAPAAPQPHRVDGPGDEVEQGVPAVRAGLVLGADQARRGRVSHGDHPYRRRGAGSRPEPRSLFPFAELKVLTAGHAHTRVGLADLRPAALAAEVPAARAVLGGDPEDPLAAGVFRVR